jgi:hypothetical protein
MTIINGKNIALTSTGFRAFRGVCLGAVMALLLAPSAGHAQIASTGSTTLTVKSGRPLADMLDKLQQVYVVPIDFEEVPYESVADLKTLSVTQGDGSIRTFLATPIVDFDVTLGQPESSAFGATQTVLGKYAGAGLPGFYTVIQGSDRVDVIPSQVLASAGGLRNVTPVMSSPVQFPLATRGVIETLRLVAQSISSGNAVKVILLNAPFSLTDTVTMGATGEAARDVIANLGNTFGVPMSSQCLYDATDKTYYLNVHAVFRPNPAGVAPIRGLIPVSPKG